MADLYLKALESERKQLWAREPFPEHKHAKQHAHQRIDEVTQTGFDQALALQRPDEDAPVAGNQRPARYQTNQTTGIEYGKRTPLPLQRQQHAQNDD